VLKNKLLGFLLFFTLFEKIEPNNSLSKYTRGFENNFEISLEELEFDEENSEINFDDLMFFLDFFIFFLFINLLFYLNLYLIND